MVPRSDGQDTDDDIILAVGLSLSRRLCRKLRKPKRWHVRPYYRDRQVNGRFFRDILQLRQDSELFRETFRMTPGQFDDLLDILREHLTPKRNTRPKDRICEEERLYITLE